MKEITAVYSAGTNVLYGCVVDMENNLERKSGGGFSREEYIEHPERYKSIFNTKVYTLQRLYSDSNLIFH